MLASIFIVSCLSACGFYVYVFMKLEREHRRLRDHKKSLAGHLFEIETQRDRNDGQNFHGTKVMSSRGTISQKARPQAEMRRETVIQLGLTVGGLAALFAGIVLLSSLVTLLHWN